MIYWPYCMIYGAICIHGHVIQPRACESETIKTILRSPQCILCSSNGQFWTDEIYIQNDKSNWGGFSNRAQPIRKQHKFGNLSEPNQHKIKSIVKRLIDQCYETYFEEEMITCKLISYQVYPDVRSVLILSTRIKIEWEPSDISDKSRRCRSLFNLLHGASYFISISRKC